MQNQAFKNMIMYKQFVALGKNKDDTSDEDEATVKQSEKIKEEISKK